MDIQCYLLLCYAQHISEDMSVSSQDIILWENNFSSHHSCLEYMSSLSANMTEPHCEPQWERYTNLCWGPTPAGQKTKVPCPDDGYLNPQQFAFRSCLSNASWYVNYSFDSKPYTDYTDCLIPLPNNAEEDLKKRVGETIVLVLKGLDSSETLHLTLHIISIVMLILTIVTSGVMVLRLHSLRKDPYKYIVLIFGSLALLLNNAITLSSSTVEDVWQSTKCRTAKYLVILSSLVLYMCLYFYIFLCVASILRLAIGSSRVKIIMASALVVAVTLVATEVTVEIQLYSVQLCGFGSSPASYHWITTGPKIILVISIITMGIVSIFGSFYLQHPHLQKGRNLNIIRQQSVSALIVTLYNMIREILLALVYGVAYMSYFDSPVHVYVRIFSIVNAAQGIVFSLFMCFVDLQVISLLPCVNTKHGKSIMDDSRHYSFISVVKRRRSNSVKGIGASPRQTEAKAASFDNLSGEYAYAVTVKRAESQPKVYETMIVHDPY
ncbi:PDF receptor-like isoform X1 [Biomphalaria glabrata]|uniref:PDF receptor-like isoform X1 n=2 Tax=Biomphalaria glabrata TaxID=6526 RepID=A0A9U8DVI8_BIOGL|nr:PDF receptor-like isoform X1 [Biomphalaria glabrata]